MVQSRLRGHRVSLMGGSWSALRARIVSKDGRSQAEFAEGVGSLWEAGLRVVCLPPADVVLLLLLLLLLFFFSSRERG